MTQRFQQWNDDGGTAAERGRGMDPSSPGETEHSSPSGMKPSPSRTQLPSPHHHFNADFEMYNP